MGAHDPIHPARAIVEAKDRLRAPADATKRHGHHQHKALHNGCHRNQQIPLPYAAIALEHSVHRDDHHIIYRNDRKGRQPQCQHPSGGAEAVAFEGNRDLRAPTEQEGKHIGAAGRLRKHCCNGRAPNTHIQHKNKQRIQKNVHHCAQHHRHHRLPCKSLRDNKGIQSSRQKGKHRSEHIVQEIFVRIRQSCFTRAEKQQHWPAQRNHRRHQYH